METNRYALFLFHDEPWGGMHDLAGFHDTAEAAVAEALTHPSDYYQVVDTLTWQVVASQSHGVSRWAK